MPRLDHEFLASQLQPRIHVRPPTQMDSTALRAALASCRAHQTNVEASIAANLARHSRGGPGSGDTELDARVTELRALLLPASFSTTSSSSSSSSSPSFARTSSSLVPAAAAASGAPPASSGTSSIDAAMAEGLSLVQKLDETADLAARVSKNVRRLDDSQSRVASALQRVRDIKGIKDCVGGLQHAIASLDFEVAVPHLHRVSTRSRTRCPPTAPTFYRWKG